MTTSAPTIILSQYRVWVMRPTGTAADGYTYPWSWSSWALQTRLIVKGFSPKAGGMGEASLELLRQTRRDEHEALEHFHGGDKVIPRAWVAISIADRDTPDDVNTNQLDPDAIEWWGFLGDLPGTVVEGTDERIGAMRAFEVGHLFDQVSLGSFSKKSGSTIVDATENGQGWCQASSDGSYPVPVNSPPTANIRTKDGQIIGNAKAVSGGGYPGYVFARKPEDCGTDAEKMWTRWRLAGHIVNYCKPTGLPTISISAGGATGGASISVMHIANIPPGSPSTGDSYLIDTGGSGDWTGHDDDVATWSGSAWTFTTPANGTDLIVTSTGSHFVKTSGGWENNSLVNYLDSTADPEVYELRNLKYRGGLEMLFPFTQGLDYKFTIGSDKASWVVNVYSASDTADYGVPAATLEDVDLTSGVEVEVDLTPALADRPDEVAFEGACCLFGFTVSKQNANFELIYDGGSDLGLAYDSADDWERNQPQYDDMYTLFQLKPNDDGDLRRSNNPGDTNTNDGPLIPLVVWDGTNAKLSTTSRCPYLPTARLTNLIPWEGGRKSDGTDLRDDRRKAQPSYLKPKVFYYDSTLEADQWAELTDSGRINFFTNGKTPEVSADDRAAAIRVRFDPKHLLGIGEFDGLSFEGQPIIDWQKILVTIAMPSDQRVKVAKRRQVNGADIADAKVITRLTVRDETLGFWCVLKGTVIGIKLTDGEPDADRVTATNIDTDGGGDALGYSIRNDWAKVERNAKRLAAWAFRERSSGSMSFAHPDSRPAWLRIGAMIGVVSEAPDDTGAVTQHTVHGLIRSYEVTLEASPRITVSVETLPMPTFIKGEGSPSPSSGGAVSPNMGGTVAQAVQQLQSRVNTIDSDNQRKIIYPATNRSRTLLCKIIGGNLLNGVQQIAYVSDDDISPITSLYDPDVDTSYIDGIGNAWLYDDNGQPFKRILIRHNCDAYTDPLPVDRTFYLGGTVTLTVASGGDMGKTMTAYTLLRG